MPQTSPNLWLIYSLIFLMMMIKNMTFFSHNNMKMKKNSKIKTSLKKKSHMMMNIFSIFDPSFYLKYFNYLSLIMIMIFMKKNNLMCSKMKNILKKYFSIKNNNNILINNSFLLMLILNISSLMNMAFSTTSQVFYNLILTSMWLAYFLKILKKEKKSFLMKLIPQHSPSTLIPFICLIETLSNISQPLTLFLRLTINMTAGHILLNLSSKMSLKSSTFMITMLAINLMELMVAIIQAYVFNMLISSYMKH